MCFAASSWASIPKIVYACGRSRVAKQHFEGAHDLGDVNKAMRHPIELVHLSELEERAFSVISYWGKAIGQTA
jgi:tRNA(Arg) A34 adenosine deaminase TadA